MAGIDTVWPYQFAVYIIIFGWGIYTLFNLVKFQKVPNSNIFAVSDTDVQLIWLWTLVFFPPITWVGYFLRNSYVSLCLSFSGNSALAWALWTYSITLIYSPKINILSTAITVAISLCVTVRALRDLVLILTIRHKDKNRDLS